MENNIISKIRISDVTYNLKDLNATSEIEEIIKIKQDKNLGVENAGKVLLIDDNGDIIAGNPTIGGVVDAAARLSTPREIALNGDAIGSAMFDGSQNISIETEIPELDVDVVTNIDYENDLAFDTGEIVSSIAIPVGALDGILLEYSAVFDCYSTEINIDMPLVSGNTYTVIWDGKVYNCIARECEAKAKNADGQEYNTIASNAIGNFHIIKKCFMPITEYSEPATSEPFFMNNLDNNPSIIIRCADVGPHTIRIYQ